MIVDELTIAKNAVEVTIDSYITQSVNQRPKDRKEMVSLEWFHKTILGPLIGKTSLGIFHGYLLPGDS